jgi:hypothetical protein
MVASSKGSKGFVVLPFYGNLWKMIKMMFKAFKAMDVLGYPFLDKPWHPTMCLSGLQSAVFSQDH